MIHLHHHHDLPLPPRQKVLSIQDSAEIQSGHFSIFASTPRHPPARFPRRISIPLKRNARAKHCAVCRNESIHRRGKKKFKFYVCDAMCLLFNAIFVNLVSVFNINDAPMSKAYQIQRSNNESRLNLKDKVDGAKIIFTFNENCRCIMSK